MKKLDYLNLVIDTAEKEEVDISSLGPEIIEAKNNIFYTCIKLISQDSNINPSISLLNYLNLVINVAKEENIDISYLRYDIIDIKYKIINTQLQRILREIKLDPNKHILDYLNLVIDTAEKEDIDISPLWPYIIEAKNKINGK